MTNFDQRGQHVYSQFNVGSVTIHVHSHTTADVATLLQRSVRNVQLRRYEEAIKLLDTLLQEDDSIADAFYYYALALLKGNRPRLLTKSLADKIEQTIAIACKLDPAQAHYYYLWAWVKYDFYIANGFRVSAPDLGSILMMAAGYPIDIPKCEELLLHAGADDSIVVDWINERP